MSLPDALTNLMLRLTSRAAVSWGPLPLRLIVGYGFMAHGFAKLSRGPDILKLVQLQGNEPSGASGAEFAAIVRADSERWGEVIRAAKIKLD